MPYALKLPKRLAPPWAVKIRDRERVEPPHVTVLRKTKAWRLDLRTAEFLDKEPDPAEVPEAVLKVIWANWANLRSRWDAMYPENPVEPAPGKDPFDD